METEREREYVGKRKGKQINLEDKEHGGVTKTEETSSRVCKLNWKESNIVVENGLL